MIFNQGRQEGGQGGKIPGAQTDWGGGGSKSL